MSKESKDNKSNNNSNFNSRFSPMELGENNIVMDGIYRSNNAENHPNNHMQNSDKNAQEYERNYSDNSAINEIAADKQTAKKSARAKFKDAFKGEINYMLLGRYVLYFAMMILLGIAKGPAGISPFHLGFFVALVYCRENIALLSIEYILALIICDVSLYTLIIAVVPPIVFIGALLVHKLLSKPMKVLNANIYAMLCHLPIILLNINRLDIIIQVISMTILSQIFTYCAIIICYAVLVRGLRYRFAKDELFGGAMVVAALSMGVFSLDFLGFNPFYLITPFVLMMCLYSANTTLAFVAALTLGVGAGIMTGNIMIIGGLILCISLSMIFMSTNIYFAALAYLLGDVLVGLYFKAFGAYGYEHIIFIAIGLLAFVITPKGVKDNIVQVFGGGECVGAERAIVGKNRTDVASKLNNMSQVFSEIGAVLGGGVVSLSSCSSDGLSKEISAEYCGICPNVKFCTGMLGGDTSTSVRELVDKAVSNGVVTIDDLPPFIAARCDRAAGMISIVSDKTAKMLQIRENRSQIGAGRMILSEQMVSISELLTVLSNDVKHSVFYDSESERRIIEELSYRNIVARDIIVSGENGGYGVTLSIRRKDVANPNLLMIINRALASKFRIVERVKSEIVGYDTVRLMIVPRYSIVYGVSNQTMEGSIASGDTYSIERIGHDKIMVALCDGMGSGEEAKFNSSTTISMIENFYKAGFNNNAILSLINKILATYNGESFTCLDMAIIDLSKGAMDIIKLGGVQSLLVRQGVINTIESGALPLGIIEEAEPYTERRMLMDGDMVVMFTDGITDALGMNGIAEIIHASNVKNPQALADELLARATEGGAGDDSTVVATRIYIKKD